MINFEDALIEKRCINPFSSNQSLSYFLKPQEEFALKFIGRYMDFRENYFFNALNVGTLSLLNFEKLGILEDILGGDKDFYWFLENNDSSNNNLRKVDFILLNPEYVNFMLENHQLTFYQSLEFALNFYIQSFLDTYNNRKNGHFITFPSRKNARIQAMKNQDQIFLRSLNQLDYIVGFSQEEIVKVSSKEELDSIIENKKHLSYKILK